MSEPLIFRAQKGDTRTEVVVRSSLPKRRPNLDDSPTPNYDDYFADATLLARQHKVTIKFDMLPIETSRGCWWGQVHHCVFCGIDDDTMKYRSKAPETTLRMLRELRDRYSISRFRISDYILPSSYFTTLLPRLAALTGDERFTLTCEIKANMTYEKFRLMRDAGFREVQPGIESFSSAVLSKMDKGVSAIQNIHTLILGSLFGIKIYYNFLFGFPDDDIADYEELIKIVPLLYHLDPPNDEMCPVQITRFAPLQTQGSRFQIQPPKRHHPDYEVVFSSQFLESHAFNLSNYCYYFEHTYKNSPKLQELYRILAVQVRYWRETREQREVMLTYAFEKQGITFYDSRYGPDRHLVFDADYASVFRALDHRIQSLSNLEAATGISRDELTLILNRLERERLVFREGNRILGLALPALTHTQLTRSKQQPATSRSLEEKGERV